MRFSDLALVPVNIMANALFRSVTNTSHFTIGTAQGAMIIDVIYNREPVYSILVH